MKKDCSRWSDDSCCPGFGSGQSTWNDGDPTDAQFNQLFIDDTIVILKPKHALNKPFELKGISMRLQLYLIERLNDRRTWILPTHNIVTARKCDNCLTLIEDVDGPIYVEQYTCKTSKEPYFFRVSNGNCQSIHADWIKRFSVKEENMCGD